MTYSTSIIKQKIRAAAEALMDADELLTEIDNRCGDGDLGISMSNGATAVLDLIENDFAGPKELFRDCGVIINDSAPSTMGTLISVGLLEVANSLDMYGPDYEITDETLVEIPSIIARAIMFFGHAQLNDKTVLDALIPFSIALRQEYRKYGCLKTALEKACDSLIQAVLNTRGMIAKIGRAKWTGERSRFCQDGGATVCAIAVNAMAGTRDYKDLRKYFEAVYCQEVTPGSENDKSAAEAGLMSLGTS